MDPLGSANRLSLRTRISFVVYAAGLIAMLVVAAWLKPNPNGYGTHRQLGLPPCGFQWLTGARCPACGMTTSWSHAVRGQFSEAARANAGGLLLAVLAAVTAAGALTVAASGRRWKLVMNYGVGVAAALAVFGVTLVDWMIRLGVNYLPDSLIGR